MNRRKVLKLLSGVPFLSFLNWNAQKPMWNFHPKQVKFFIHPDARKLMHGIAGIPYHENNGTTSKWLGIERIYENGINR